MQKLFGEVLSLDKRCYDKFFLTEDILMEHAADGISKYIRENFEKGSKVTVVCGSGNNGADGLALSRLLYGDYEVEIFYAKKPRSQMAILQELRAIKMDIKECDKLKDCDVLVDALIGTGFSGKFDTKTSEIIESMNSINAYKIACDVPSGYKFYADITLTMGALKKDMFLDAHKDYVGEIKVLELGVSRDVYELQSNWNLLDLEDLELPHRDKKDSHKGSFGHLALACGEKSGASIMSAKSALRFGAGLVTLVGFEDEIIPHTIMYSHELPKTTTALALGMGLGAEFSDTEMSKFLDNDYPIVCDADIFHMPIILKILKRDKLILTPHAKEFTSLLKQTNLADISTDELQLERFKYMEMFCEKYPNVVLILKGANVIIGKENKFYINPHGTSKLAKGGSGDVLSGLVGALLAQGFSPIESAINASLAHTKLALNYKGSDFSLTPDDLINGICNL